MRRSDLLIRAVSVIVFVAIVCYIGYSLVDSWVNPLKTVLAVSATAEDSIGVSGYVVRSETLLAGDGDNVVVLSEDGDKLAVGQAVAVKYMTDESFQRAGEISEIQQRISYIEDILNGSSAGRDSAWDSVIQLAYSVASGDLSSSEKAVRDVSLYVFSSSEETGDDALNTELADLNGQLSTLESQASSDTQEICTNISGVFSAATDGFEYVDLSDLSGLTPSSLEALFSSPQALEDDVLGKLVTDVVWYYAAVVGEDNAKKLSDGDIITVRLSELQDVSVTMEVVSIGHADSGKCVVVLSCDKELADLLGVRSMSADIVFKEYSGIRVPAEALHMDEDDNPYIYVMAGLQAHQVTVEIQGMSGAYYIVSSDDTMLYEGADIIVSANNLYDGKVVG